MHAMSIHVENGTDCTGVFTLFKAFSAVFDLNLKDSLEMGVRKHRWMV